MSNRVLKIGTFIHFLSSGGYRTFLGVLHIFNSYHAKILSWIIKYLLDFTLLQMLKTRATSFRERYSNTEPRDPTFLQRYPHDMSQVRDQDYLPFLNLFLAPELVIHSLQPMVD